MKADKLFSRTTLWTALLMLAVLGCAGKPFDPPAPGDMPKGPGIFTKGDGAAVLYDSKKGSAKSTTARETSLQSPAGDNKPPSAASYEAFEAYQKWLEWKKKAVGSSEYEEFKQWRQWRQYQQWKNRQ